MKYLIALFMIMQLGIVNAQSNIKVNKAIKTFQAGKIDKAIGMMEKIIKKDPSTYNWNLLVNMHYERYEYAKSVAGNAFAALLGQSLGVKMTVEKFARPSQCYFDLVSACKRANLYSQSTMTSQLLRNYFVDHAPDTGVSKEAKAEFDKAEEYFKKKDFESCKECYKKALALEPNYYKATIYIGDSYWYLENMDSAIHYFNKGIKMQPDLLEPRKYMVDALAYSKKYDEAKNACIEAIYIYPDVSMFIKYSDVLNIQKRTFNDHWVKRGCEINLLGYNETKTKDPTWSVYQNAGAEIESSCDSNGLIVKLNDFTKAKYLEVYSWEKMLKSSKELPAELSFAKEMADIGFLDCYVFLSAFHYDMYPQYVDFVKGNKDRIKKYIETYLVE